MSDVLKMAFLWTAFTVGLILLFNIPNFYACEKYFPDDNPVMCALSTKYKVMK